MNKKNELSVFNITTEKMINETFSVGEGFIYDGTTPLDFQTAYDWSTVKVIVLYETDEDGNFLNYQMYLRGSIFYNFLVTGLQPIEAEQEETVTGFSTSGSITLNEDIGTVTTYQEVYDTLVNNASIVVMPPELSVKTPDGEIITYDEENPEAFYELFDGTDLVVLVTQRVDVTAGPDPIS